MRRVVLVANVVTRVFGSSFDTTEQPTRVPSSMPQATPAATQEHHSAFKSAPRTASPAPLEFSLLSAIPFELFIPSDHLHCKNMSIAIATLVPFPVGTITSPDDEYHQVVASPPPLMPDIESESQPSCSDSSLPVTPATPPTIIPTSNTKFTPIATESYFPVDLVLNNENLTDHVKHRVVPKATRRPNPHPVLRLRTVSAPTALDLGPLLDKRMRRKKVPPGPFAFIDLHHYGSFGATYATRDFCMSEVVYMKVIDKRYVLETDHLDTLLGELRAYQRIIESKPLSPHLMQLDGVFQDIENVYFAMELMECDLRTTILKATATRDQRRRWLAQTASGIHALHQMGIMHRDVKSESILIDSTGNARVGDFGSALVVSRRPLETRTDYANASEFCGGTHGCIAPEMYTATSLCEWSGKYVGEEEEKLFSPRGVYGIAVDWWSLGCVWFELLAKERLFRDLDEMKSYVSSDLLSQSMLYLEERVRGADVMTDEMSLLSRLLKCDPDLRHTWNCIKRDPIFNYKGYCEFDVLDRCTLTIQSLASGSKSSRYVGFDDDDYQPEDLFSSTREELKQARQAAMRAEHAAWQTERVEQSGGKTEVHEEGVWQSFGWINPKGLWKAQKRFF
ncbi:hypothetical protein EW146_g2675 [Bondarzewia mesenterica]|uniref:non-specific serine/threonine protein kinase n=1 Tax=Bondarzewia mesenterica TaxID=1095465 RepID=A0A4S4M0E8_9AGAM|nr:hypothetical protein EW146_g2675 [Bondarzewia mesenterica]